MYDQIKAQHPEHTVLITEFAKLIKSVSDRFDPLYHYNGPMCESAWNDAVICGVVGYALYISGIEFSHPELAKTIRIAHYSNKWNEDTLEASQIH